MKASPAASPTISQSPMRCFSTARWKKRMNSAHKPISITSSLNSHAECEWYGISSISSTAASA